MLRSIAVFPLLTMLIACATNVGDVKSKYKIVSIKTFSKVPRPTVIVLHGCDGFSDGGQSYHQWASRINSWGYNTIVLNSFSNRGYSNICKQVFDVMPFERAEDVIEVAEFIKAQPWHQGNIGVIGFSHGGSTAINIAARKNQDSVSYAIAFYPGCNRVFSSADVSDIEIPMQMHLGEKDSWTPHTECLIASDRIEQFVYKGATHAFDMNFPARNYAGHWLQYNQKADTESKQHVKEFIEKHAK